MRIFRCLPFSPLLSVAILPLLPFSSWSRAPLGASVSGWSGDFSDPQKRLAPLRAEGFDFVSLVPTYVYEGNGVIDLAGGPSEPELAGAIVAARRLGLGVVLKPHVDPPQYAPRRRAGVPDGPPWRGQFELDPLSKDYQQLLALQLSALADASRQVDLAGTRLELGSELMRSEMEHPEDWQRLLPWTRARRKALGLEGKVLLSHNFAHHIEIPQDYVLRLSSAARRALGGYISGLDAVSLSQYMDLTAAMPAAARGRRLPTPEEVAAALRLHERDFERDILVGELGLRPDKIPPLHLGEFGVGTGGLIHPNLWSGALTPEQDRELRREIARADAGLLRYLSEDEGRLGQSAALWTLGRYYDVFGWSDPADAVPEAAAVLRGIRSR